MRRILGLICAVPLGAFAFVLVITSAGSIPERVFFAACPGLFALRLALGKGRAPGLIVLSAATSVGVALAALVTSHPIGDTPYPLVERIRYAGLLAGVATTPLVVLLPFRGRTTRAIVLVVAVLLYLPVAFVALQVHRPHVRASWDPTTGPEPRRMEVEAADGAILRGWSWNGRTPSSPLVVLVHGIGSSRQDLVHMGRVYRAEGWAVAMFDSRGHGESDSMTVTFGMRERNDVHAIIEDLTRHDRAVPVALHGCSMGGAIALQAAARIPQVRAVIAEAAFYDLASMAEANLAPLPSPIAAYGRLVFRALAPYELGGTIDEVSPARAIAARRDLRTLLIADGRDHVIPPINVRKLHRRAAGPSELWELANAQHCSAWAEAPEELPRRVTGVLREAFRADAPRAAPAAAPARGAKRP